MNKCLVCFHPVDEGGFYHQKCARTLFESTEPSQLEFSSDELTELATKVVATHSNVTGIQAKISLSTVIDEQGIGRFTVDYKGKYILKPASDKYPGLPEVEATTMQLAEEAGIAVVPHGLIKMNDGKLAYITRRMDRVGGKKVHQEDLCQLSERLTEDKYKSSCERVGKTIMSNAVFPKIEIVKYFELVIFNFLHGNNDMHLKNYSMTHRKDGLWLSAAYDLLNVRLVNSDDDEETALTINGKKKKLKKQDFDSLAENLNLLPQQRNNVYKQMNKLRESFEATIDRSLLTTEHKDVYKQILIKNYRLFDSLEP
ncbi:MAG: HipA domain-containing protein [Bacteroidota bacterium]